ncbi:MAG: DUF177 domain-containing protein [Deltaproteobacteria bacterium]|nr:DUF177 domain-containing protein [Deltaproteobacteria bacterium]
MKVRIDDLPSEGRTFEVEVEGADLDQALGPDRDPGLVWSGPAQGTITLNKAGRSLRVQGEAGFRFTEPCARCLTEVNQSERAVFDLTKLLGPEPDHPRTHEVRDDEVDEDYLTEPEIDLTQVVLEQVALELPQRVLCTESCKGLCPQCGTNLNNESCRCAQQVLDPRFAMLAKLRKDDGTPTDR